MASLMDWITQDQEEKSADTILRLQQALRHRVGPKADQMLLWDAEICTLGETSTPIEEALNDACSRIHSSVAILIDDDVWRFYQFETTWVLRLGNKDSIHASGLAVLVSEEFRDLNAEGVRT